MDQQDRAEELRKKAEAKGEELKGQAQEQWGEVTGEEEHQAEGKKEKTSGRIKQAGEKVKDVFRNR